MPREPLQVLINACTLPENPTGIGVYALELATALARRDDCHVVFAAPAPVSPGVDRLNPPATMYGAQARLRALLLQGWTQCVLPIRMRVRDIDVYHGTEFTVPVFSRAPRVSTVHDLAFLTAPHLFHGWGTKVYFRAMAETARSATRVVVPSPSVADEVTRALGVPTRRIRVTPLAGRSLMRPASPGSVEDTTVRFGLRRSYVLCVGTWNSNKRIVDAIRAIAALKERGIDVDLALAGEAAPFMAPHYRREAARLGITDRVHYLGHVADGDLPALYTGSLAFVFPSEYEGFGLPPLEAMACGTPVVVSNIPVLQEHCAGAAMVVPTRSPSAISDRLEGIIKSPSLRDEWVGLGFERAAHYSWDRTAAATMAVYREIT